MKLKAILVAVSGDSADEEVVKLACSLSIKAKAKIYVVYVNEVKRSLPLDAVVHCQQEASFGLQLCDAKAWKRT